MSQGLHNDALWSGQTSLCEFHFERFPQPLPDHAEMLVDLAGKLTQRFFDCGTSRFFHRLFHHSPASKVLKNKRNQCFDLPLVGAIVSVELVEHKALFHAGFEQETEE